mgnify:CR=1 FL=1
MISDSFIFEFDSSGFKMYGTSEFSWSLGVGEHENRKQQQNRIVINEYWNIMQIFRE